MTSEPSLLELQRWMKSRIRAGDTPVSVAAEQELLNPQGGSPGVERLAVYAGGYLARSREALTEVYEAVRHVMGPKAFTALSEAYATRHPSREYNLSFMGRHLPEFLTAYPLTQSLPFLPDLAALEWLVCRAFHAFERPPMDPSAIRDISLEAWARSRLVFQPSVGVIASTWPILDIWAARQRPVGEVNIDLVNRPQRVLVFRHETQVRCELLDAQPYALLSRLLAGQTCGEACRPLDERHPAPSTRATTSGRGLAQDSTPPPVAAWFAQWAQAGLIVRCDFQK